MSGWFGGLVQVRVSPEVDWVSEVNSKYVLKAFAVVKGDAVPMIEPCRESASKDLCLCTSMKAGMRSPGLYCVGTVALGWWRVEQPRDREMDGVILRVEGMLWVGCAGWIATVVLSRYAKVHVLYEKLPLRP
jgi:hypothetical protein